MKAWKEAASLILAARYTQHSARTPMQYNYKLLCLKRHQNSSNLPGTYVFPGGMIEPADADLKWRDLFSVFGFDGSSFSSLVPNISTRPKIFTAGANELPREISLRISAIRETFEECGLLLCKRKKESDKDADWSMPLLVSETELQYWQKKVHEDATQFYVLCNELKCYPDLWSLHEWSNWMSPTSFPGKRYDTAFFLACIPHMPLANYEVTEMEGLKWDTPKNFLLSSTDAILPPPQHYELARLARFEDIESLREFAAERSKLGIEVLLPVAIQVQDGRVSVLPGDSLYPEDVSLSEEQVIDKSEMTIDELRAISQVKNRVEFITLKDKKVVVDNLKRADGHLPPMEWEFFTTPAVNKL